MVKIREKDHIHQIRSVLRLKIGDRLILVHNGEEGEGEIKESGAKTMEVYIEKIKKTPIPPRQLFLALSVLKKDNFEWAVQKAVEVGVGEIIPFTSKRTIKKGLHKERIEKIIKEATEQAGWGYIPLLRETCTYEEMISYLKDRTDSFYLTDIYKEGMGIKNEKKIGGIVGPEGGISDEERLYAYKKGALPLSLGEGVLRAETAAIITSYHILYI